MSKRIQTFKTMYQGENILWDLCCDHGLIGESFLDLDSDNIREINFLDNIPSIIEKLAQRASYITKPRKINIYLHDCTKLKIINNETNLIIIAGIGGLLLIEILQSLLSNPHLKANLILSPHTHLYEVRRFLNEGNFKLIDELLLFENNQYYEFIHVKANPEKNDQKVQVFSSKIYQFYPDSQNYLKMQLKHYEMKARYEPIYLNYIKHLKAFLK
jgi:tRNA (adenine22-N1)-methyltransferase